MTSQKHANVIHYVKSLIAEKQTAINEVYSINEVFSIEYHSSFIYSVDKTFRVIKIMDFNRTVPRCYSTFFLTPVPAIKMELFHT